MAWWCSAVGGGGVPAAAGVRGEGRRGGDRLALVGERFGEFFETTAALHVTEDFTKSIYRAVPRDQVENLRLFARQYKPSLR